MRSRFELLATVLQDGHVDPITGPRCMVQMQEGPHFGLYLNGHAQEVLRCGTPVLYDEITRRVRVLDRSA